MVPGLPDGEVLASSLERWSLPTHFGQEYGDVLNESTTLRVLTDSTCVRVDIDEDSSRATGVTCRTLTGGTFSVEADRVIVAAGGLESTRLLMCSPAAGGRSAGDHSGHLGHWYMAHLEGVIADLGWRGSPAGSPSVTPRAAPPAQRLSLTGTKIPGTPYGTAARSPVRAHLRNVLADPAGAARFAVDFGAKRVFSRGRKPPGFFVWNADNRYPLQ